MKKKSKVKKENKQVASREDLAGLPVFLQLFIFEHDLRHYLPNFNRKMNLIC